MFQIAIILLTGAFGLVSIVVGALNLAQIIRFVWRARAAPGVVSEIVELEKRPIGSPLYQARVRFSTRDGREIQFDNRNLTGRLREVAGQKVTVLYDPANPAEAMIRTIWMWLNPIVALLSGSIFIAICVANLAQLGQ
jgi:hypothetical protein